MMKMFYPSNLQGSTRFWLPAKERKKLQLNVHVCGLQNPMDFENCANTKDQNVP